VRPAAVELSEPLAALQRHTRDSVLQTSVVMALFLASSAVAVALLGIAFIGRPMQKLVEKTRRVGAGDLGGPLQLRGHDELAELGRSMNAMCEQLAAARVREERAARAREQALEQLRHADRLRTVGSLASGLAHELGTPLNVVLGRAEMIAADPEAPEEAREGARIVAEQSRRMSTILRQLLDFARRRPAHREPVDLRALARETVELLRPAARKRSVDLRLVEGMDPGRVSADAGQLQQVLTNLLLNALQASPEGSRVELSLGRERAHPPHGLDGSEGEHAVLRVEDQGHGIAPAHLAHVFDPFFTTKDVGEGTGLGLSVSYGIVRDHGGWIEVESEPGHGAVFRVLLPVEETAELPA
jgi:signal transduction histidine kinase